MNTAIAIVGLACRYPDARNPSELWENVLAQRRAFRRIPSERLSAADYVSKDADRRDQTYVGYGAVIEGYEFDRVSFCVSGDAFRSADLTHWLALDIAAQALVDAGFSGGSGLPRETTGVVLGNTLTGEFSRSNLMRLRWPFVRRMLEPALAEQGWVADQRAIFLEQLEGRYKAPFPPMGEDTLAGGLSNTIAGRVCNHFDLNGGGYTVDGACSSSLLAFANACSSLAMGDLDVAVAGGVDLSLDPFELVGFARAGALSPELMRVYDLRSQGFWPGEGCGMAVLMRESDAVAQGKRIYARILGWGISSDGQGGMTRPEVEGQILALRRAYSRAGCDIGDAQYFEGHGTGTSVGDATELTALTRARRESEATGFPAALGTIKANIGHTKAAAGAAGLLKTALAIYHQTIPPTTGCERPVEELTRANATLRRVQEPESWTSQVPRLAGISAMGFGGINSHIVLGGNEREGGNQRSRFSRREEDLGRSVQDAELFIFATTSHQEMTSLIGQVLSIADRLSWCELVDLASALSQTAKSITGASFRAAIVAGSPPELAEKIGTLAELVRDNPISTLVTESGVFFGQSPKPNRIGFLFPGQGSPSHLAGGIFRRRFLEIRHLYTGVSLPKGDEEYSTQVAQPALAAASAVGLWLLNELGIAAEVAIGHSLGELVALHWAGAFDRAALLRLARARGEAMGRLNGPIGSMAAIAASGAEVSLIIESDRVVIAGYNSLTQTVISGETADVDQVVARAKAFGWRATRLPTSHAFHSPLMAGSVPIFCGLLAQEPLKTISRRVLSTVVGRQLEVDDDLRELLCRQMTTPVRFWEAACQASHDVDLFLEVGSGQVLSGLVRDGLNTPVIALDIGGESLQGLLKAAGAAFALGCPVRHAFLFEGRLLRPFSLDWRPQFFTNPCELAPARLDSLVLSETPSAQFDRGPSPMNSTAVSEPFLRDKPTVLELVRRLVAERAELPLASVHAHSRFLNDLHLNSITVGQLAGEAAKRLGLGTLKRPTDIANSTVSKLAALLENWANDQATRSEIATPSFPVGVDSWVRPFSVSWRETSRYPTPLETTQTTAGDWQILAPENHPLSDTLKQQFLGIGGGGIVFCLQENPDSFCISLLLAAAQVALQRRGGSRFVIVQHGRGASSFARTLHLEAPELRVAVIDVPFGGPQAASWVRDEALAVEGFIEVRYDAGGKRFLPSWEPLRLQQSFQPIPLTAEDILLVSGGGKGISAESAILLARQTGVRLALVGRSQPEVDGELSANLTRMASFGIHFQYQSVDITDIAALTDAVARLTKLLGGPVTALLHGAGNNSPCLISALTDADFRLALAPKIIGFQNLLEAIDADRLKLVMTFGSIIGRAGLAGEAHYALANEWLTHFTEDFARRHPKCRCVSFEWSVWSGVGMGARMGQVELLHQQGITSISPEIGLALFESILTADATPASIIVTGRLGGLLTTAFSQVATSKLRFMERVLVNYSGVELIAEAELSLYQDPYVVDHVLAGSPLFPGVMGLEAMAQVAMCLANESRPPTFQAVKLHRPIVVPTDQATVIRIAALVRQPGKVDVVIRSSETSFQVDHFSAECRFQDVKIEHSIFPAPSSTSIKPVDIDIKRDIYEALLFHQGRFQRIEAYEILRSTECRVLIRSDGSSSWFGHQFSADRVLGCTCIRDAALHAIQACIPQARILPVSVEYIARGSIPFPLSNESTPNGQQVVLMARERSREGNEFTWDLELQQTDGSVLEQWIGLRLRQVGDIQRTSPWPVPLLSVYLERQLTDQWNGISLRAILAKRRSTEAIVRQLCGEDVLLQYRLDGKPEIGGSAHLSMAHSGDLAWAVTSDRSLGCDLEPIVHRAREEWKILLGPDRVHWITQLSTHDEFDRVATGLWNILECLKKAGLDTQTPIQLDHPEKTKFGNFQLYRVGAARCLVTHFQVQGRPHPLSLGLVIASSPSDSGSQVNRPISHQENRYYPYFLTVSFEETNVVGNVYFANYVRWQGRVREQFLADHAPSVLAEFRTGLELVTLNVDCRFVSQLFALDRVVIRMALVEHTQVSARVRFEYVRMQEGSEEVVAVGNQEVAACRVIDGRRESVSIPDALRNALLRFQSGGAYSMPTN